MKSSFVKLLLFSLLLFACHHPLILQKQTNRLYTIQGKGNADSNLIKMLAPYKLGVDTQMNVVIGHTDVPLTKAQPESTLGNFMADAQLVAAKKLDHEVVASFVNYGGIRISYIAPGAITRGKMFELMPFDNTIAILEVSGEMLKHLCNHIAKGKGWPVAGIHFKIKDKEAQDILLNGNPVNDNVVYKITLSDYLARGGDNCDFFEPVKKRYTSIFLRDAMMEYVQHLEEQHLPLHPKIENRIEYAE
jgi:2',3'-cyclic-nucleotide 2'-phosphodiesterase (5'-nucleotidase family)